MPASHSTGLKPALNRGISTEQPVVIQGPVLLVVCLVWRTCRRPPGFFRRPSFPVQEGGVPMTMLVAISIGVVFMLAAYWLYAQIDGMVSKAENAVRPYVPEVKKRVTTGLAAAAQYAKPRAAGWARRMALGVVANVAVIFAAATCVALVRPAPTEVTYESIAKRPDATWYQHAAAYVGYGSGWCVDEVRPGFLYSVARLNDGSTLIGLPGVQKWYRL